MTLYHFALGTLYGVLFVLAVTSLASAMLSSAISRWEERGRGLRSHSQTRKGNQPGDGAARRSVNDTN